MNARYGCPPRRHGGTRRRRRSFAPVLGLLAAACGGGGERVAVDPLGNSPPVISEEIITHFFGHPDFAEMLIAVRKPKVLGEQHWTFCGVTQRNRSNLKDSMEDPFAVDWDHGVVRFFDSADAARLCAEDPAES